MPPSLLELHDALGLDGWRQTTGFPDDMARCHERILDAASPALAADALRVWLQSKQPCIFGRKAAKDNKIALCILRENDLVAGDDHVAQTIATSRRAWLIDALFGRKHSFVFVLATERLMWAEPDAHLLELTKRLLSLYLNDPTRDGVDDVVLDTVYLRVGAEGDYRYLEYQNGLNVFACQGDGRWWHDHRIPGGIAFTLNPVGQMARSWVERLLPGGTEPRERLLGWALPMAMLTIQAASRSKRAGSWLHPRDGAQPPPFCPATFKTLTGSDWRRYAGRFHTDHTINTPFFRPDVERPSELTDHTDLDFSYLQDPLEADHKLIGTGEDADPLVSELLRSILDEAREGHDDEAQGP